MPFKGLTLNCWKHRKLKRDFLAKVKVEDTMDLEKERYKRGT